jgi:hypothetical protein
VVQETHIVYSAKSTRWFVLSLVVVAVGTLIVGLAGSSETLTFVGLGALAFVGLFAHAVRTRLRADELALYREGDWLLGAALPRPFLAPETRYEVASDYEGGWIVVLADGQGKEATPTPTVMHTGTSRRGCRPAKRPYRPFMAQQWRRTASTNLVLGRYPISSARSSPRASRSLANARMLLARTVASRISSSDATFSTL